MQSISEKTLAEQSSTKSVSRFFDQYRLGSALRNAGASKQKGVLVSIIFKYLIALIYTGKSMFQDMRSAAPFAQGFRKDAVYRLLNLSAVNWQAFLLSIAHRVKDDMERLTSQARRCAFIVDDTMFAVRYAEKSELVSKVYDHAEKGRNKYKWGFRMLSLLQRLWPIRALSATGMISALLLATIMPRTKTIQLLAIIKRVSSTLRSS